MSIRAHRVDKKIYGTRESFNLWHDEKLVNWIDNNSEIGFFSNLNMDGCGEVEIPIDILERAIKEVEIDKDRKKTLIQDIKWAKEHNEDYILYDCF